MTTTPIPTLPDWVKVGAAGEVKRWAGGAPNGRATTTTIERLTPTLIITADGERYPKASYRAYASGAHFRTNRRGLYWSEIVIRKPEDVERWQADRTRTPESPAPDPLDAVYALADRWASAVNWEGKPAMVDRAFATELLAVLPPRTTTDRTE